VTWELVNLAKLEPRPRVTPSVGGFGAIYPGKRHTLSGPPESGKTLAGYAIAIAVARTGGYVLIVDFEMGPWDTRDRLREMGATDEELERIVYVAPELPPTEASIDEIAARFPWSLVIIDAAAGAYDLAGLDDEKRKDVERFARLYVRAFHSRGIATLVIDHVRKRAEDRGPFVIGSERKLGGVDVHIGFETKVPLSRGGRGLYKLWTHKDRLGHLPRPKAGELEFRSDPRTHSLSWTLRAAEPTDDSAEWKPTVLMEKVSLYLEEQADAVTRNTIEKNVRGTGQYVRDAIDALIADEYVEESAGPRRSRLVRSLKPYRESTASAPRRHFVATEWPDSPDDFVTSSAPGGGDDDDVVGVGDEFPTLFVPGAEPTLAVCVRCDSEYEEDENHPLRCRACTAEVAA
jgi:hypothetical protein